MTTKYHIWLIVTLILVLATVACSSSTSELNPEQNKTLITWVIIGFAIWVVIGILLLPFGIDVALNWWILGIRLLLLVVTLGKVNIGSLGRSGSGGSSSRRGG